MDKWALLSQQIAERRERFEAAAALSLGSVFRRRLVYFRLTPGPEYPECENLLSFPGGLKQAAWRRWWGVWSVTVVFLVSSLSAAWLVI